MQEKFMSLVDHIGELRKRLIAVLIVFAVSMAGGLVVAKPVIRYLQNQSLVSNISWHVFAPWDAIRIYMQLAFVVGLLSALPFILYQIWAYLKPGLRLEEQRATFVYIPGALICFLAGLAFAYFVVFPMAFEFTSMMASQLHLTETCRRSNCASSAVTPT